VSKLRPHIGVLSYVAIMLFIGVPLWWKTTEVYRADLPYDAIDRLSDISQVSHEVNLLLVSTASEARVPRLQKLLLNSQLFNINFMARAPIAAEVEEIKSGSTIQELDLKVGNEFSTLPGSIALMELPSFYFTEPKVIPGNQRTVYYAVDARDADIVAVVMDTLLGEMNMQKLWDSASVQDTPENRVRKKSTGNMDLQVTLVVPEPEYVSATWNIKEAVDTHLQPFLDNFPLKFRINSQVLYLTSLHIPAGLEGNGPLEVGEVELGTALNRMENLLNSQSSSNPALNLVLYIPPLQRIPLTVRGSTTNSFLLPRWGGVHIYNYLPENQQDSMKFPVAVSVDMDRVAGIWLGQLRSLLGVAELKADEGIPLTSVGVRLWESDYQLRYRSMENILETRRTLQSLASLLSHISNIVITEEIARRVEVALAEVGKSVEYLAAGRLQEGHQASQTALQQAEAAFFDPSLLALLYFPDDQKYAIYVPYFLPVGLPVLLSFLSIVKQMKSAKPKED